MLAQRLQNLEKVDEKKDEDSFFSILNFSQRDDASEGFFSGGFLKAFFQDNMNYWRVKKKSGNYCIEENVPKKWDFFQHYG